MGYGKIEAVKRKSVDVSLAESTQGVKGSLGRSFLMDSESTLLQINRIINMNEQEQRLALAIQKPIGKPNMGDESVALLEAGGILFTFRPRVDDAPTNISGLDIIRMRNGDLSKAVACGEADLVIVGLDMYQECPEQPKALMLRELGFGRCVLKLGVKDSFDYQDPTSLTGLRVATSYPYLTAQFFSSRGVKVRINAYQGGEETVVNRGFAEACAVISDTGTSLRTHGLKPVALILESEAVLLANPNLSQKRGSEKIVWRALRAIMTGLWKTQYTMLEANFREPLADEVLATLPALGSPTVAPLQSGGQATRSLVPMNTREESLRRLYVAGASEVVALEVKAVYPNLNDPEVTRMMRAIYGADWQFSDNLLS